MLQGLVDHPPQPGKDHAWKIWDSCARILAAIPSREMLINSGVNQSTRLDFKNTKPRTILTLSALVITWMVKFEKTCGLLSQSSLPAQPILGQVANFAPPFKNEHQLTSPGCAQIFLLFSYLTCSVQNLKTAVRTASAPENAFKVKDRFATCVERNSKQCKT